MSYVEDRGFLGILSCNSGHAFSELVINNLSSLYRKSGRDARFRMIDSSEVHFANGEIKTVINEPIRGADIYVIQLIDDPLSDTTVNDNLMALGTAINAAYNSDANSVTAVIPQFPNSRQERRKGRESLTACLVASFLEMCGANRVLTMDIHAEAIAGFFKKAKMDNLHASSAIIDHLKKSRTLTYETVFVAPDVGSAETARFYSRELQTDMAIVIKERDYSKPSTVIETRLVGTVAGRDIIIIDDMIATGGTLIAACSKLKELGARRIDVAVTFPFFNSEAVNRIDAAVKAGVINSVTGTNAVFRGDIFKGKYSWYHEVDVSSLFAEVIYRINHMESISENLL